MREFSKVNWAIQEREREKSWLIRQGKARLNNSSRRKNSNLTRLSRQISLAFCGNSITANGENRIKVQKKMEERGSVWLLNCPQMDKRAKWIRPRNIYLSRIIFRHLWLSSRQKVELITQVADGWIRRSESIEQHIFTHKRHTTIPNDYTFQSTFPTQTNWFVLNERDRADNLVKVKLGHQIHILNIIVRFAKLP